MPPKKKDDQNKDGQIAETPPEQLMDYLNATIENEKDKQSTDFSKKPMIDPNLKTMAELGSKLPGKVGAAMSMVSGVLNFIDPPITMEELMSKLLDEIQKAFTTALFTEDFRKGVTTAHVMMDWMSAYANISNNKLNDDEDLYEHLLGEKTDKHNIQDVIEYAALMKTWNADIKKGDAQKSVSLYLMLCTQVLIFYKEAALRSPDVKERLNNLIIIETYGKEYFKRATDLLGKVRIARQNALNAFAGTPWASFDLLNRSGFCLTDSWYDPNDGIQPAFVTRSVTSDQRKAMPGWASRYTELIDPLVAAAFLNKAKDLYRQLLDTGRDDIAKELSTMVLVEQSFPVKENSGVDWTGIAATYIYGATEFGKWYVGNQAACDNIFKITKDATMSIAELQTNYRYYVDKIKQLKQFLPGKEADAQREMDMWNARYGDDFQITMKMLKSAKK